MKHYYVYIMSSRSKTLYTGVTNNLIRRVFEHKQGVGSQFTRKYRITRLVHFEETQDVLAALTREKQIKSWTRAKKLKLIDADNPEWKDLSEDWDIPT
ncbi:MAG: GIY-YIG nuclease family protein [Nitrospira sp.]|nr:GIY-YIG nuclease family protein [Nitrospira sp.]